MNDDTIYVTFTLTLENVDTILNALEEKITNVQSLKQNIYNIANNQIEIVKQQRNQQLSEENIERKEKKKKK